MAKENAAIWWASDGYDPGKSGVNGRRMAGESFIRGYVRHMDAEELRVVVNRRSEIGVIQNMLKTELAGRRVVGIYRHAPSGMGKWGAVFYPSPGLDVEAWRRYGNGQDLFSITGITHTTSTKTVMERIQNLVMGPIEPWDALICTSNAVFDQVSHSLEVAQEYVKRRFGRVPENPMLPVIPLGIDCNEFDVSNVDGDALRAELGIAKETTVAVCVSRLNPVEKFDPVPLFLAMQRASERHQGRLALLLCGFYADKRAEKIFVNAAKALMPDVAMHVVDGKDRSNRSRALAAADAYTFPIENMQETFGLAPIEGMAAGLPVITTDWNGIKDTVDEASGFRVPTRMADTTRADILSFRLHVGADNYYQFLTSASQMISYDIDEMAGRFGWVMENRQAAREMGERARKRAREVFDWAAIVPQYQELWAEQRRRRERASADEGKLYEGVDLPVAPKLFEAYASYPSIKGIPDNAVLVKGDFTGDDIHKLFKLRDYAAYKRSMDHADNFVKAFDAMLAKESYADYRERTTFERNSAELWLVWLEKMGFIRIED